jgi:hypothetical protein
MTLALGVVGLAIAFSGAWMIYPPAALIALGVTLFVAAVGWERSA